MIIAIWRNPWSLSVAGKRSSSSFTFFLRYYKDVVNLLFWVLCACLATQNQSDTINLQKTFVFICRQKINFTTMLFWRYCKDIQTSYYGYFEHTWLHTPKMIVSTCRRLWCLSACQKYTSSIVFFLRYYILKNAAIWLADSILAHNSRARILPDVALLVISTTILVSISGYFQEKLMTKFFKEPNKPYLGAILGPFCSNLSKNEFSSKKGLSQFLDIPIIYHCTYN